MKSSTLLILSFSLFTAACASSNKRCCEPVPQAESAPATLEAAIQNPARSPENRLRDSYRHPKETLEFFGLKKNMTVLEITPGAGWYTEILAPYLNDEGQYVAVAAPDSMGDFMVKANAQRKAWLAAHANVTNKTQTTEFNPVTAEIAPGGSADMVLTFRNIHNWMLAGTETAAFKSFFNALKPGGILGVVEHRAKANQKPEPQAKSGYVREADVIKMAQKAGFKLVAKSEINANPKDTKDYPDGVWTLPPTLRLKDKDREKYLAIGESDRMTLKFVKP